MTGCNFTLRVISPLTMQRAGVFRSTECSICLEAFRDPRLLPCGHAFCTPCLRQLVDNNDPIYSFFRRLRCPLCRSSVAVPVRGARGFPRGQRIVDELANSIIAPVISSEDVPSNDQAQGLPRDLQMVDEFANQRVDHTPVEVSEMIDAIVNRRVYQIPAQVAEARELPTYVQVTDELVNRRVDQVPVEGPRRLPRNVGRVDELVNRRVVQNEDPPARGHYYFGIVALVIAFFIYLRFQYQMDIERDSWASEKRSYALSETRLKTQILDLKAQRKKEEEAVLSEKEKCAISEELKERQIQELIAKEKKDALLIERMEKYIDKLQYSKDPVLTKTFQLEPAQRRSAMALMFIDGNVLVANSINGDLKLQDAYSVTNESDWATIPTIPSSTVAGMGLCPKNGEVFVSTWNKSIFRFSRNGEMLGHWSVKTAASGAISLTDDCSVVLAVRDSSKRIITYSPVGEIISEVRMKADILGSRLMKAVQIAKGHLVVSYGEGDDPVHGIDTIDANGQTLKSHGWRKGAGTGQLFDPRDFVVDAFGNILLADSGNGRILLLDSQLKYQRELVSTKHGLQHPLGIILNERETLLYVADNKWDPSRSKWTDGRITVFKIR